MGEGKNLIFCLGNCLLAGSISIHLACALFHFKYEIFYSNPTGPNCRIKSYRAGWGRETKRGECQTKREVNKS